MGLIKVEDLFDDLYKKGETKLSDHEIKEEKDISFYDFEIQNIYWNVNYGFSSDKGMSVGISIVEDVISDMVKDKEVSAEDKIAYLCELKENAVYFNEDRAVKIMSDFAEDLGIDGMVSADKQSYEQGIDLAYDIQKNEYITLPYRSDEGSSLCSSIARNAYENESLEVEDRLDIIKNIEYSSGHVYRDLTNDLECQINDKKLEMQL